MWKTEVMSNAFLPFLDLTSDTGSLTGLQLADYARPDDPGAPGSSPPFLPRQKLRGKYTMLDPALTWGI